MENTSTSTGADSKIVVLTRVFRLGSLSLADPDPSLPPEKAVALYSHAYPVIVTSALGDPFIESDTLVYPVKKSEVKTKG